MKFLLFLALILLSGCTLFTKDSQDPSYSKFGFVEYLSPVEYVKISEIEPFSFSVSNDTNEIIFEKDDVKKINWSPEVSGLYTITVYYKTKEPNIKVLYNPLQKS